MDSPKLTEQQKKLFVRQHYGIVGNHSAVKLCGWTRKSLHDKGVCYKQKFYGISCHRCMQCTPVVNFCTQNCKFCWRLGSYKNAKFKNWDNPKKIVEGMIEAQRKLISGFPGSECNMKKWEEAQNPKQVAISLAGEPTLYPELGELIKEFHKRSMTTFLVTNGTLPEVLKNLKDLPIQLYVTLAAPDKKTFNELCKPNIEDAWERLNETLKIFSNLKTKKVVRLTLVKDYNMHSPEKYAELIKKANPDFVEVKAFMSIGGARKRMGLNFMPYHKEVKEFSEKLSEYLEMPIADEQVESRVVLLTNLPRNQWIAKN